MSLDPADARYAVLALIAEQSYSANQGLLAPLAHPRLTAMGYVVLAHITAVDQIMSFGSSRVNYGYLASGNGGCVAVFRGTERALEWAEDADATEMAHPITGLVHAGFWGIYETARLLTPDGVEQPLVPGILEAVHGSHVTLCGHSLGSPLATYTAYDLSVMHADQVAARLFASPRPGDTAFSGAASKAIVDHVSYAYELDLVPKVPFGWGYAALSNRMQIPENSAIPDNPASWHHCQNYAWLLDPSSVPGPV